MAETIGLPPLASGGAPRVGTFVWIPQSTPSVTNTTNNVFGQKPVEDTSGDNIGLQYKDELFDGIYSNLCGFDILNNINQKDLINQLKNRYPEKLYKYDNNENGLTITRKLDDKKIHVINYKNTTSIKYALDSTLVLGYDEDGKLNISLEYNKNNLPLWKQEFYKDGQSARLDIYSGENVDEILHTIMWDEKGRKTIEKLSNNDDAKTSTVIFYYKGVEVKRKICNKYNRFLSTPGTVEESMEI